jgi:hypothetical protein
MNTNELEAFKHGIEGATAGFLKSFHDLVSRLAGPPAEELGLLFQDQVRIWRFSRAQRLASRVEKLLEEVSGTPRPVALKVLLPSLEYASLEEDDFLQDHWATLLTRAADPKHKNNMLPVFVEVLKQLSTIDARLLADIYGDYNGDGQDAPRNRVGNRQRIREVFDAAYISTGRVLPAKTSDEAGDLASEFRSSLENLVRLGLLERRQKRLPEDAWISGWVDDEGAREVIENQYYFSTLGKSFVLTCRPKQNKDND